MQIKKLFKYLPIAVMAAGLAVATSAPLTFSLNNNYANNQIFNTSEPTTNANYSDQLQYIRNDVAKQTSVKNPVVSIKIADSSAIQSHTSAIAVKADGSTLLYMWGRNDYGQLGNDTKEENTPIPTLVTIPGSASPIKQIALGQFHSAALLDDGSLYMWGLNFYGQLGNTTNNNTYTQNPIPTKVTIPGSNSKKITKIALGSYYSAALLGDDSLYMWGLNNYGQLGNTTNNGISSAANPTPTPIATLSGKKIHQISLGQDHSAALVTETDGSTLLYMWGRNFRGQLGFTKNESPNPIPMPINLTVFNSKKIDKIEIQENQSAALLADGSLYMWGQNDHGQLGNTKESGTKNPTSIPTKVTIPDSSSPIIDIALGKFHAAAFLADGSLYMWGNNRYGQLGNTKNNKNDNPNPIPAKVTINSTSPITKLILGGHHSSVLLADGSLYMWGWSLYGQLTTDMKNIPNPVPILMSKLGRTSDITANSTITPKNAVDNFWVDNKFNLAGFKNSFNLTNILETNGQNITMDTEPRYDNVAGTVTMNIKIGYYYDENGSIVTDTSAKAMTIAGFSTTKTNITAKTNIANPPVVDKWEDYVKTNGKYVRTKLEKFLNLIDVPTDAEFTITNSKPINKTGVLTFKIATNKVIDGNGATINTPSGFDPFSITLNLTPRITKMNPITTGYPANITPTDLKAKLFDNNWLIKDVVELRKYVTIAVPVDGVSYHLVDGTWNPLAGDGTAKFDIYVSQYYDGEGELKTGGASVAKSKVSFNLKLQREASSITLKTPLPEIRIDKFEAHIISGGTKVDGSKLGEYFDLTNIPSDAKFTINNVKLDPYNADFASDHLTFDLSIDKFNQGTPATPQTYTHKYELTLGTLNQPTAITAKTTHDQMIRVDKVANELNTLEDKELVTYLSNFLDFASIPDVAIIDVENVVPNDSTGELSFAVVPSKIYNSTSDLASPTAGQFTFNLQFDVKHAPTDMVINPGYTKVKIDEFAKNMTSLKGQDLYDYLVSDYVIATTVNATELTSRIISQDNQTGKIRISLTIQSYYDENSDPVVEAKTYTFDFQLNPRYQQTVVKTLDTSAYPKDITPAQFKQQIIDGGATIDGDNYILTAPNIAFLKKFISLESVPVDTIHSLTWNVDQTDEVTGALSINLSLNQHYSATGDLVTGVFLANDLTLNLLGVHIPIWPETKITVKPNAPLINSAQSFLDAVYPNNLVNSDKLSSYVDGLQTIPSTASITNISVKPTRDILTTFIIDVSAHYNASGTLQGPKSFEISLSLTPKFTPTSITVLSEGSYPSDITPSRFKQIIIDNIGSIDGNAYNLSNANINFLNRFLDLSTVPPSTTYTLIWNDEQTDDITGKLGFNLIVNKYYNSDGDLVTNSALPFNDLALNLTATGVPIIWPETILTSITDSPTVDSEDEFMGMIYATDSSLISSKLALFVHGLATIPGEATIVVEFVSVNEGIAKFTIIISSYYDGISEAAIIGEKTFDFEVNVKFVPITAPTSFYWWWWILIVIGVVAFLFIIWLLFKKKYTEEEIQTNITKSQNNKNIRINKNKLQSNLTQFNEPNVSEGSSLFGKFKHVLRNAQTEEELIDVKTNKGKLNTSANNSKTNRNTIKIKNVEAEHITKDNSLITEDQSNVATNNNWWKKANKSNDLGINLSLHNLETKMGEAKLAKNSALLTAWTNRKNARMRVQKLLKTVAVNDVLSNIYGNSDNTPANNFETNVNIINIANQKTIKDKQHLAKVDSLITDDQSNVATNSNWWTKTNKSNDLEVNLDLHDLGSKHAGKFNLLTAWINWKNARMKVKRLIKTVAVNDVLSNIYVNSDDIPNNFNEKLTTKMNDQSLVNDIAANITPGASDEKSDKISLHVRTKNWITYHKRLRQLNTALATKSI